MEERFILDATAGFRMMWYNKQHPNCIYLDNRPECEPDVLADHRDLKQFPDERFKLIIFDPPHEVNKKINSHLQEDYGVLSPETWQSDLKKAFKELWRVLAPFGVLLFKWHDGDKKIRRISPFFPAPPLIRQVIAKSKGRHNPIAHTYWFCFMKLPETGIDSS